MSAKYRKIVLAKRPNGWVQEDDFQLVEQPIPTPSAGEVLIRTHYLSLDPYMRGRMNASKSYAASVELGDVMVGEVVGEIVASERPDYTVGEFVAARLGWQEYALSKGDGLRKVDASRLPISTALGVVGMPGVTAWVGLFEIGEAKAGDTVVVAAAAGAVGSVVGQLAKKHGCRAIGIAGGAEKCAYVVNELGFDACIDYKADDLAGQLSAAAPNGVDVYFENVGGEILETVVAQLNTFGRIALCGLVSQYNATEPHGFRSLGQLLSKRIKLQGFIVGDHLPVWPQALAELSEGVASGQIRYHETIAEGLENAPKAFIGMLKGANLGKQLVKLI